MSKLKGKVAVVTGATRGAGKGIAIALGEAGATVYVTGRSTRDGGSTREWPGTIEETAEAVTAQGGVGIPIKLDHADDAAVQAFFSRVKEEQGHLDLLVNNAWGGNENTIELEAFWVAPLALYDSMFTIGVRSALVASRFAVPLMLPTRRGLIINTTAYNEGKYTGNLAYDLAKNALNRLAFGMSIDLRQHGVTAVSLAPGWMRTELVLQAFGTDEAHWKERPELEKTESPLYMGRAVAALAADPTAHLKTGKTLMVADLAREYGFTDLDGRQPPIFKFDIEELMGNSNTP